MAEEAWDRSQRPPTTGAAATPHPPDMARGRLLPDETAWGRRLLPVQCVIHGICAETAVPSGAGSFDSRKASALLQSVRRASLQGAEFLSVAKAWSDMDNSAYQG